MVDELNVDSGEDRHSIELVFHLESDSQERLSGDQLAKRISAA
jgi:hypothetical protein